MRANRSDEAVCSSIQRWTDSAVVGSFGGRAIICSPSRRAAASGFKVFLQGNRVVMLLVLGAENKRYGITPELRLQLRDGVGIFFQLTKVPFTEFAPFLRAMSEPIAECCSRRDVLQPQVNSRRIFRCAARPDAVDQYSKAIFPGRRFVSPFQ